MENRCTHGDYYHNLVTILVWVLSADSITIKLEFCFAPEAMHFSMAA